MRMNDRDAYYFKRVYIGCIKAIDFIFTLPEFNGTDLAVTGQSQGGMLSIVTAGLDKRVKYLAPIYPGGCDMTRFLPPDVSGAQTGKSSDQHSGELETISYFDVVNFARRVTIPGYYSWGYNDVVCHPTCMYAAYNIITAPKELHIFQETGHWTFPEEQENVNKWLIKQIKGL
jgi:cephalosporin-C deacetylase